MGVIKMLTTEYFNNKRQAHCFYGTNYSQKDSFKNTFDIILRLANEGKINSDELNTLLSFCAAKLVEKEVENRIDGFMFCDLNKFFEKRFFND
jgi:hypothetical protein